ncbi:RNA polymerase sigma-70 factor [Mucilaginibacter sp. Bleaf8]|uniref:RNA polymerase sigma-70 factor n=1 Tax=Mucilaginibacter sp. Bleaf8 TaxID=2834430 RepID=UPI001BCCBF14|nr:RNA polymerase sigma-70 factor [Mucilaginibacter sp. Bleaf8]MBS7565170.1 RNA polymerase sigma-70 factor [Mucilaginibacter sp. Bleaf8]
MVITGASWWNILNLVSNKFNWPVIRKTSVYRPAVNADVLAAFIAGDETAFRIVYEENFKKLYIFSFKFLKNKEQAEEVVNDAFLNVWINREKIDPQLPIAPYLYTVTKRLALNVLRQIANSQKAIDDLWKTIEQQSNETEDLVFLKDLQKFADSKISVLPPQQQQIFRLSRNEGLNYEQIAEKLNISKNTVRNHMALALKTLRSEINPLNLQ